MMPLRPRWENVDHTDDYRADATAIIRWESLHAVISTYSNRDANAYGKATDYTQEIMRLDDFFDHKQSWIRERFGDQAWDEMMDLASQVDALWTKLEDHFRPIPEDLTLHDLNRENTKPLPAAPLPELPEEIWVADVWSQAEDLLIPCRSYCWPTLLLRCRPTGEILSRSALGHPIDPPPVGYWRDLKIPM